MPSSFRVSSFKGLAVGRRVGWRLHSTWDNSLIHGNRVSTLLKLLNDTHITAQYSQSPHPDPFLFPKLLLEYFKPVIIPPKAFVTTLLKWGIEQHRTMPNVLRLHRGAGKTVTICGDTHGQYHDFCRIFSDKVAGRC
ncbi:hypothetical protein EON65_40560 [archaeon]|nr:MAG: hypothetical protein EON65_40560 [archaeon]